MWIAYFLNYTDRQVVFSIFPILRSELRFSDTQLGLTGSIFLWVYALCSAPAGLMGDRVPRRKLIVGSLGVWTAITALTGASASAAMLLGCRGLMGVAESLFFPSAVTLTAHAHRPQTRSRAVAVFSTAQILGSLMGAWYGGFMADRHLWRWAFYSLGIAGALYVLPYHLFLKRCSEPPPPVVRPSALPALVRIPSYLLLCVVFPSFTFVLWLLYTWLPNFFFDKFSLSMADAGLASAGFLQVATLAGLLLGGVLADHLSRAFPAARFWLVAAGLLLCAPAVHFVGNAGSLALTKAAAAGFGLGSGLAISNFFPCCFEIAPRFAHATAAGTLNLLGGFISGFSPLLVGLLKKSVGLPGILSLAGALCLLASGLLFWGTRRWFCADAERASAPIWLHAEGGGGV
jgi:MFS family permease